MHRGDREPVAGDADEAHESLVARLDGGPQRPVLAHRHVPFGRVDEAVELDQVDLVDPQPLERAADLLARGGVGALAGLRREEEAVAVLAHPGREPQLGVAVARGGVDVVDPVLEQQRRARRPPRAASVAQSAAAPKMTRELSCPVAPNGFVSIISAP